MLEIHNLTKTYYLNTKTAERTDEGAMPETPTVLPTLDDISLQVKRGEFVSILGPSGCGKTTLFNLISGLEKPDRGAILLEGKDITGERGYVSYMLQKDLLFPWRTILENCILGMEIQGIPRKKAREKARTLLAEFNLAAYEDRYPHVLSGGMRQRAAFLRTMLANKEILLLDEPFGALDAYTKSEMHEWLMSIWSKYHPTILFITHDIEEALFLSDRIYVLSACPAKVKYSLTVALPRPRKRHVLVSEEFIQLKKLLLQILFE
ncbi:MAG: ABC transporter ATP-binding protein [Peptococcia bacterium]|jgi:ABC-type nitrate/sulfonate/bicarbonate transport system ATPase subunit